MSTNRKLVVLALSALIVLSGCKKKVALTTPPPPPPPAAPTASISVSPSSIQAGDSATLTWQTTNATDLTIDGIGTVDPNGTRAVSPTESRTYVLVAKGPAGSDQASARLTVSQPPPAFPSALTTSEEELFSQNIKDVYFDFDEFNIRSDQQGSFQADMAFLSQHPNIKFLIEGHCDERGSVEYNLALGDSRAGAVKNALISSGVAADRINTISYGKEMPFCTESNETCWQQNRKGHFVYQK